MKRNFWGFRKTSVFKSSDYLKREGKVKCLLIDVDEDVNERH